MRQWLPSGSAFAGQMRVAVVRAGDDAGEQGLSMHARARLKARPGLCCPRGQSIAALFRAEHRGPFPVECARPAQSVHTTPFANHTPPHGVHTRCTKLKCTRKRPHASRAGQPTRVMGLQFVRS